MRNLLRRTPKDYDGPHVTTHRASEIAPHVLCDITAALQNRPDIVLATWATVIGAKLAAMTEAVSFLSGVLTVRVKNSTMYSLCQRDKARLLAQLRRQLPTTTIYDIVFRMS